MKRGATLRDVGEKKAVELLVEHVLAARWMCPSLRPGDDAACIGPRYPRLLLKIDGGPLEAPYWMRPSDLGWQWVAATASDLAAKAAKPLAFAVSLGLPPSGGLDEFLGLVEGAAAAAEAHGAWLSGGDTNSSTRGPGWIDVAAVGEAVPPWGPVGLQPGPRDHVYVTVGRHGLGWLALKCLEGSCGEDQLQGLREWSRPIARLEFADLAARLPRGCITAATDTSDGLAEALGRLGRAAGAEVVVEQLPPLHPAAEAALAQLRGDTAEAALYGGQEYEIVAAARPGCRGLLEEEARRLRLPLMLLGRLVPGGVPGSLRCCGRRYPGTGWDQFRSWSGSP